MKRAGGVLLLLAALVAPSALAVVATTATPAGAAPPMSSTTLFSDPNNDPGGLVGGPDGRIWFTEPFRGAIARMNQNFSGYTEFPIAQGSSPRRIIVGPDGNLWFTENGIVNKIGHMTTEGFDYTEIAVAASDLVTGPDGNVWATESDHSRIARVTPAGGVTETDVASNPSRIINNPDGALWFAGDSNLHRITTGGAVTTVALSPQIGTVEVLTSTPDGTIWLKTSSGGLARATTGGIVTLLASPVTRLVDGVVGPDGAVWITNNGGGLGAPVDDALVRVDPSSNTMAVVPTLPRGARNFGGITSGPGGALWFSQRDPDQIVRMSTDQKFPAVTVATTANPATPGNFDLTATVASVDGVGAPSGYVVFRDATNDVNSFGTATLSNGVATLHNPNMPVGSSKVVADYSGDATFTGNFSNVVNLTVNKIPTTISIPDPPGYSRAGDHISFTATITEPAGSPPPTGTVRFFDQGGQVSDPITVSFGSATYQAFGLPQGLHNIYAIYDGDSSHVGSQSPAVQQFVDFNAQLDRYVESVYIDLLGRLPDDAGRAYWTGLLANGTQRAATSWALVTSTEYRSDVIAGMYEQFLLRDTDNGGLSYWVSQIARGMTFEQFQSLLMGSDEYFQMAAKGNGDDDTFVRAMYHDVLGRDVDAGGEAYFVSLLQHGTSRSQVVGGIVYSAEHLSSTVDGYYQFLLGRPSDPGGNAYWTAQLQHGARDEVIVALIIGSDEYYSLVG